MDVTPTTYLLAPINTAPYILIIQTYKTSRYSECISTFVLYSEKPIYSFQDLNWDNLSYTVCASRARNPVAINMIKQY